MSFSNETAEKVRADFDRKRKAAQESADARKAEIHEKIPQTEEIDRELSATGLKVYECAISGGDVEKAVASLHENCVRLRGERDRLLTSGGYPADYTDVKYECDKCSDTGYDGLRYCECYHRAMVKEAYLSSGLGGMLASQSFDNFSLDYYGTEKDVGGVSDRERMQYVLKECRKYADSFGNSDAAENLLFLGGTGLGKTHLSTSIAKKVIEKGYSVIYESSQSILAAYEAEKFSKAKSGESSVEKYLSCDLLIIDDLGAEFSTQFTQTALYNLLNTRICAGKAMIVSSNLNDGSAIADKYENSITSRLIGNFRSLRFCGSDIRLQKRRRTS